MRRIISWAYGPAYRIWERLERVHVPIMMLEIGLLLLVVFQVLEARLEDVHEAFDCALCVLLSVILVLDLAVRYRRRTRGYLFGRMPVLAKLGLWRSRPDQGKHRALLDRLRGTSAKGGPVLAAAEDQAGRAIVAAIAKESAAQFSFRAGRYSRDPQWEEFELRHLHAWFAGFPAALWHVPSPAETATSKAASPEDAVQGYFSVVVPIDEGSYDDLRDGVLPSLCARLDPCAVAFAARPQGKPLRLLAYVHVAVIPDEEAKDPELMLSSSLGHLASLLLRFFPDRGAWRSTCHFSIVCEVSNASQGETLRMFGFTEVQRSHDGRAATVQTPAGFELFEAYVTPGKDGAELLRIIEGALPDATSVSQDADHLGLSPPRRSAGQVAPAMG